MGRLPLAYGGVQLLINRITAHITNNNNNPCCRLEKVVKIEQIIAG